MIIHNTENSALIYVEKRNLLYITLIGFCSKDEVNIATESLRENIKNIKKFNILADTSKLGVIRDNDIKTIVDNFFPAIRDIGVMKSAVIKSGNIFGELSVKKLLSHVEMSEVQEFDNMNTAETWLL